MFHKHFISSLWETCTYCLGGRKCILNYLSSYLGMIIYLRESLFYLAPIFAPLILLILVKLLIPQMDLDESHFTFMIGVPIIRLFRQRNLPIMVFISSMMPRQPRQARASTSSASVDTQAPNVVERNIWISDQGTIIYTMRAPQGRGLGGGDVGLMHFHFYANCARPSSKTLSAAKQVQLRDTSGSNF